MLGLDVRRVSVLLWRRASSAGETTRNVGAHFAFTSACACDVAWMRLNCDKYVCVCCRYCLRGKMMFRKWNEFEVWAIGVTACNVAKNATNLLREDDAQLCDKDPEFSLALGHLPRLRTSLECPLPWQARLWQFYGAWAMECSPRRTELPFRNAIWHGDAVMRATAVVQASNKGHCAPCGLLFIKMLGLMLSGAHDLEAQ
ncbi:hypothetical protein TRVL_08501 [Trypanosoma vivax]|nr:hypothetical protein TRVL_08501 [Trypanosoma vivax]